MKDFRKLPPPVLLVEDQEDDVLLIEKALKSAGLGDCLQVCRDGEEAIQYLSGEGKFGDRRLYPMPRIVLLDLKMPKVDGFEVLDWIRKQSALSGMRTIVLTSSKELRDVTRAYQLGASSFLVKPIDFNDPKELIDTLLRHWPENIPGGPEGRV